MPITFIVERISNGEANGVLKWPEMGLESEVISGPYGNGELPSGTYEVPRSGLIGKDGKDAYCDKSGNCWFQYIAPQFSTNRSQLGIHPDGNVRGTRGCIGLLDKDTSKWYEAFKSVANNHSNYLEVSSTNA